MKYASITTSMLILFLYFSIELIYAHELLGLEWMAALEYELPLKITIATSILLVGSVTHIFSLRTKPSFSNQFKGLQEAVISTIFSPASLSVKTQNILEKTFQSLPISFACIASYQNSSVNIISQHSNNKDLKVTNNTLLKNQDLNPLEKMILEFYATRKPKHLDTLNNQPIILIALKPEHLTRPIGLFMVIFEQKTKIEDTYYEALDFLAENLGFALSIWIKKDETLQAAASQKSPLAAALLPQGIEPYVKLQETLVHEAKRYKRYGAPLTLLVFSIDYYENLCNIFGKEKGTTLISEITLLVKNNIRSTDVIAHWEKEIYAIVLADNTFREATALANKLRGFISKRHFGSLGKAACSFGVSMLMSDEDSIESLKLRARQALKKAQNEGGNRVEVALLVT